MLWDLMNLHADLEPRIKPYFKSTTITYYSNAPLVKLLLLKGRSLPPRRSHTNFVTTGYRAFKDEKIKGSREKQLRKRSAGGRRRKGRLIRRYAVERDYFIYFNLIYVVMFILQLANGGFLRTGQGARMTRVSRKSPTLISAIPCHPWRSKTRKMRNVDVLHSCCGEGASSFFLVPKSRYA